MHNVYVNLYQKRKRFVRIMHSKIAMYVHIRAQNCMSSLANFFMIFALLKNNKFILIYLHFYFLRLFQNIVEYVCMGNSKF